MFSNMNVAELRAECKACGIVGASRMRKAELIASLELRGEPAPEQTEQTPAPEQTAPEVKAPEPIKPVEQIRRKYESTTARNRAKARRRALRASGFQACA